MPAIEPRPPVERFLVIADIDPQDSPVDALAGWLDTHNPASVLLSFQSDDPVTIGDALTPLQAIIQDRDIACLLEGDPNLADALGCDGVQVTLDAEQEKTSTGQTIKNIRQQVGDDLILGVACGPSRHAGMLAAEQGADYVVFGPTHGEAADLALAELAWWQVMMEPPCVADYATTPDAIEALYQAGADFVMIKPTR
ncbi:MAG: thiamine phosphate synthase [Pseudomonadota bacterium]